MRLRLFIGVAFAALLVLALLGVVRTLVIRKEYV
jgi:hypothetical protein